MKHIEQLREVAPYIRAHQNTTLVVLLPGEVQQQTHYATIIKDLLLLHSIGVRLVTIFGCREQINKVLQSSAIDSQIVDGRRVTTAEQMELIIPTVARMQFRHNALFSATAGVAPLPSKNTSLIWGNWITAQSIGIIDGVDFGLTGKIRKIDTRNIEKLLDDGHVVAIHPLAPTRLGDLCNIASEDIAEQLAQRLSADKLIVFADLELPDRITKPGSFIDYIELERLLPSVSNESQKSLLKLAVSACKAKVHRVHLIDNSQTDALLRELFTRDGYSLMVTSQSHEKIEQARSRHIPAIHELISPMEKEGYLRSRSLLMLEQHINDFYVLLLDGAVIGCATLHRLSADMAELACFVIATEYRGRHKGFNLLAFMEQLAVSKSIRRLAILTTQTSDWFEERGFVQVNREDFSGLFDAEHLDPCRNARMLVKTIDKENEHSN